MKITRCGWLWALCLLSALALALATSEPRLPSSAEEVAEDDEQLLEPASDDPSDRDPEEFLLLQVDSVPGPSHDSSLHDFGSPKLHRQPQPQRLSASSGKPLCSSGKVYIRPETELPAECRGQQDCPAPYFCDRGPERESSVGSCCLLLSEQEPPPVGCPFGTRPLKTSGATLVTCTPGVPAYNGQPCPGGAQCYYDSVEKVNKCCGKDPGEGCPSGSKAVKQAGQNSPLQCTPGSVTTSCPSNSLCQWSYLIDRYQCCEADNGCPNQMVPQLVNGKVQACQPGQTNTGCPVSHECSFNFWSASYQCCGRDFGLCPVGQVSYLEPGTLVARSCSQIGTSSTCPTGYICTASSTGQGICCGSAGQCPSGFGRVTDAQGHVESCSPTNAASCSAPASCQQAVGGIAGQFLCCTSSGTNPSSTSCPSGRSAYPSAAFPQRCGAGFPNCPVGMFCESTGAIGQSICCTGSGQQSGACPNGFSLSGGVAQYCVPTLRQCAVANGASCQASATTAGQFLCCVPGGVTAAPTTLLQCFLGTPVVEGGRNRVCSAASPVCPGAATCQAAQGQASTFICCATGANPQPAYACPSNLVAQTPLTVCSNLPGAIPCPSGSLCEPAVGQPSVQICCKASTSSNPVYTCPNAARAYTTQAGVNTFCSVEGAANQCVNGFSCQRAANSPQTLICCAAAAQTLAYTCANGRPAYYTNNGGSVSYPQCASRGFQSNCPNGYVCQAAANAPAVSVCCGGTTATNYQCPSGVSSQKTLSGTTQTCSAGNTAVCQTGFSCQPSANQPSVYVCCQALASQAPQCPGGVQPFTVQPNNQLSYCTQLNPSCPPGYRCEQATNRVGTFLCCATATVPSNPSCPDGFTLYPSANSQPVYCNRFAANGGCPGNSLCLANAANAAQPSVCCQSGVGDRVCPAGGSALLVGGQVQYCIGPNGQCSSSGYTCQVSALLGRFVCCTSVTTTLACSNGQAMYRPNNNVFYCNQASGTSACPTNYDCAASNRPSTFVCCLRAASVPTTCSSGGTPYRPAGLAVYCSPGQANVCPTTATCQASNVPNSYICCLSRQTPPSSFAQCPVGWDAYTPPGGSSPQTCRSVMENTCPTGYSCKQTTVAGTIQCCRYGTATTLRCYNGQSPQLQGTNPKYCNVGSPDCGAGFTCQASTQTNTFICCRASASPAGIACPSGASPDLLAGGGGVRFCTAQSGSSAGCDQGSTCQLSTRAGYKVCCRSSNSPSVSSAQCIGRNTLLSSGVPRACRLPNTCPNGYECSTYTTSGGYLCCAVTQNQNAPVCPGDAVPYRTPDTHQLHYCSNTNYKCPDGFVCKGQVNAAAGPAEYVCCSGKPGCQRGWLPYFDSRTLEKKTCSPFDVNPCSPSPGPPYKCQQSTVPGTYLCCMESMIDLDHEEEPNDAPQPPIALPVPPVEAKTTEAPAPAEKEEPEDGGGDSGGEWEWKDGILVRKGEA